MIIINLLNKGVMATLYIILLFTGPVSADVIQEFPNGSVDWEKGFIYTVGIGSDEDTNPVVAEGNALTVAKVNALRDLNEIINTLSLDSKTLIKNELLDSDIIRARTSGVLGMYEMEQEVGRTPEGYIKAKVVIRYPLSNVMSMSAIEEKALEGKMPLDEEETRMAKPEEQQAVPPAAPQK